MNCTTRAVIDDICIYFWFICGTTGCTNQRFKR